MTPRLATAAYAGASCALAAAIFRASSLPRVAVSGGGARLLGVATNLFHVPLYAALFYLIAMSLVGGRASDLSRTPSGVALALTILFAASDEWHQSFVPGRTAALSDLLLDVAGVATMLLLLHAPSRREVRR